MNDRIIGYTVIIALIVFLIAPVSFLIWKSATPVDTYIIEFAPINSISFLDIQDPVYSKGVEIGQVRLVENHSFISYALIEISKDLKIFSDYQATIIPKGIMGDRYLDINPGKAFPRLNPEDTLHGSFVMGPAEAISYVGLLRDKIHTLAQLTERLKNGTAEKKSLVINLWEGLEAFDSISSSIAYLAKTLDLEIEDKIDALEKLLQNASLITLKTSRLTPSFLNNVEKLLTQSSNLIIQLNTIFEKSSSVVSKMQKPELIIWNNKLKNLQVELKNTLQIIENIELEGIKLPVKLSGKKK